MTQSAELIAPPLPSSVHARQPLADYCQTLFARLGLGATDTSRPIRSLGVTSCSRGEGVTTVAAQLAATAARSLGLPVVLVDCNCANPGVHRAFDLPIGPGLRGALSETRPVSEFVQPSSVANLSLLTAGGPGQGTALELNSPNVACLLGELKQEFSLLIVDLPAIGHGVAAGIGALLDGLLLVVEAEKVRWEAAQRTTASLRGAGGNLLGVVMNKRKYHVPDWLYDNL